MVLKILMFSRALNESLQARSSQTACIPCAVIMNHGVQTICQCSIYMDVIKEFRGKEKEANS